jgi:hypothetical protein
LKEFKNIESDDWKDFYEIFKKYNEEFRIKIKTRLSEIRTKFNEKYQTFNEYFNSEEYNPKNLKKLFSISKKEEEEFIFLERSDLTPDYEFTKSLDYGCIYIKSQKTILACGEPRLVYKNKDSFSSRKSTQEYEFIMYYDEIKEWCIIPYKRNFEELFTEKIEEIDKFWKKLKFEYPRDKNNIYFFKKIINMKVENTFLGEDILLYHVKNLKNIPILGYENEENYLYFQNQKKWKDQYEMMNISFPKKNKKLN